MGKWIITDLRSCQSCVFCINKLCYIFYRIANLELMSEYGAEAWKRHNSVLQQMVEGAQKQLVELRQVFGGLKQAEHLHFVAAYDKS